ncbi:MAG: cupin domain-containing protein [Actinomycetota bacterium]
MANVFEPRFEPDDDWPEGYDGRFARVGAQAGSERLGATVYEVPPGNSICPYHWHAANEEMLIVLSGRPTLRTPQGERELAEGEIVAFPVGEGGAHKVTNKGDGPVRVLIVSEMNEPEVAVYPDSGKVMARQQAPGREATGLRAIFRESDAVDYFDGEVPPGEES